MTSGYAMTSRLVQERIEALLTAAMLDQLGDGPARVVRLAAAALALVQQHTVDDKGRCRFCTRHRRRRWRRVRARPCTVHAAFGAYLTQPYGMVRSQLTDLLHHRHTGAATAMTMPIPRLSDW